MDERHIRSSLPWRKLDAFMRKGPDIPDEWRDYSALVIRPACQSYWDRNI